MLEIPTFKQAPTIILTTVTTAMTEAILAIIEDPGNRLLGITHPHLLPITVEVTMIGAEGAIIMAIAMSGPPTDNL